MELRQLRYLVVLAEERQFTRAAHRLQIAQPGLSQQIAKLEADLGVMLVDRTTRRIALTEAGDRLVTHARRIIAAVDGARAEMDDIAGLRTGRVLIGASPTMGPVDLSGLMARFHQSFPGVEMILREDASLALVEALRAHEIDIAFVSVNVSDLMIDELASEQLVIVVQPGHHLAGRGPLAIKELRGQPMVGFHPGATIRSQLEKAAARAGFLPRVVFETNDVMRTRSLVNAGLAAALLPRSEAERSGPAIEIVEIAGQELPYTMHVAMRAQRRHPPAAVALREIAVAHALTPAV